jgi:hypothetical protein
MSRTLFSLAGFQVIITGRFWVIAEDVILQRLNLRQDLAAEFLAAAQAVRPDEVVVLGLMSQVIHRTGTSFVTSTSRRMTQSRN